MSEIDAMFAGMAAAQMNGKGNYMGEGRFLVRSKLLKQKTGFRGRSVIFEFEVTESTNPAHPVGSTGSWVVKLDKPQAFGDLKALIFALAMDLDPKTVKSPELDAKVHAEAAEIMKAALDADHARKMGVAEDFLIGLPLRLETTKVKTSKGGDFTVHNWSPAEEAAAPTAQAA